MDTNTKLIWTNRALNVVAFCGVLVSAVMAAASKFADIADELTKAGVVPAKWAGAAALIAILGHIAAKYSKTPSQAIAAAVPPSKAPPGPPAAGVIILLLAALALPSCKTTGTGPGPTPVPIVNGVIDCAAPSFFQVVTFAVLVPLAEHAIAQQDPIGALTQLVLQYGEAEVSCVAAYLNDLAATQSAAAPSNQVVKTRASVTAQWLARESAKGVGPVVNYGAVPGQ